MSIALFLSLVILDLPASAGEFKFREFSVSLGTIFVHGPGTIEEFWHPVVDIGLGVRLPIFAYSRRVRLRAEADYGYLPFRENVRFPMDYISDDQAIRVNGEDAHIFSGMVKFEILTNRTILNCAPFFSFAGGVVKRSDQVLRSDSPLLRSSTTRYGLAGAYSLGIGLDFALRSGKAIIIEAEVIDANTFPGSTVYGIVSSSLTF